MTSRQKPHRQRGEILISKKQLKINLIIAHIFLGLLISYNENIAYLLGVVPVLLFVWFTVTGDFKKSLLALFYYASSETLLRSSGGSIGYEVGKYMVIIWGVTFALRENKKTNVFLICLVFILPSLLMVEFSGRWLPNVLFSVSGIIALLSASHLLFRKKFSYTYLQSLLIIIIYPILSTLTFIILETPNYNLIDFRSHSNFASSGGYAPVHVSTIFAISIVILLTSMILGRPLSKKPWVMYPLIGILVYRCFLTFSRTGMVLVLLTLILSVGTLGLAKKFNQNLKRVLLSVTILAGIGVFLYGELMENTNGMFYNRFTGRDSSGDILENIEGIRGKLVFQEWTLFLENPILGIGPGNITDQRLDRFRLEVSSHNEYSRLLAEHGIFGLFVCIVIITIPILERRSRSGVSKAWCAVLCAAALLSFVTCATRTTLPLLIYSLGLVQITKHTKLEVG